MKNQYFGDQRDLVKYDLLVDLAHAFSPEHRLTLLPMLTAPDGSAEGNVIAGGPGLFRREIWTFLADCVRAGRRDISGLEQMMPLLGVELFMHQSATYFDEGIRRDYFTAVPVSKLSGCVVFIDPDVGLQTGSFSYMRRSGLEKYLLDSELREIAAQMDPHLPLVVYQHLQHDKRKVAGDIMKKLRQALEATGAPVASALTAGDVSFLVMARDTVAAGRVTRWASRYADGHRLDFVVVHAHPGSHPGAPPTGGIGFQAS